MLRGFLAVLSNPKKRALNPTAVTEQDPAAGHANVEDASRPTPPVSQPTPKQQKIAGQTILAPVSDAIQNTRNTQETVGVSRSNNKVQCLISC